ncbi:hypothetical protein BDW59DRAFT_161911 [Aspergillus cavernicola]|uniref:Biogenesis of lysosome-related organelles complex 1 subunit 1 n=1 Tax=Aspergillus cavernicola TaxID=176166 RepID=A0ABR4IC53_9EURO
MTLPTQPQPQNKPHPPSSATPTPPNPAQPQIQPQIQIQPQSQSQSLEATSAFTATLHSLGTTHTASLVDRTKNLHNNASALRAQEDQLARTTADLGRQNTEWEGLAGDIRDGLKEIGDVQNWAEVLERELLVVEEVLRGVEEEDGEEEGRGRDMEGRGEGRGLNGGVNGGLLNGNGKIDEEEGGEEEDEEEDGKGKKGKGRRKGKETEPAKRGWFNWW